METTVLRTVDVRHTGRALGALPGVLAVTADPIRQQLVVRYDPNTIDARGLARAALPFDLAISRLAQALLWSPRLVVFSFALAA